MAQACLALQDRHGIDVNLLLFAVWAGARGQVLVEADLRAAADRVRRWQTEIVQPLRALRRRLKEDPHGMDPGLAAGLRRHIAAAELDAEHVEQVALSGLGGHGFAVPAVAVERNLAALVAAEGLALREEDRRDLGIVAAAAL